MDIYYVYQLVDPRSDIPFYIGKGKDKRAEDHLKLKHTGGQGPKQKRIDDIRNNNLEPIIEYLVTDIPCEDTAYDIEEYVIESIGLENLTNVCPGRRPPSLKGYKFGKSVLEKRSKSLKGIPRTAIWRERLSKAKMGEKNPMYGKKMPMF